MKLFLKLNILFALFCANLDAFGPITHLMIAKQYIDIYRINSPKDRAAILIGAVYPDIRFSARVPRWTTHHFATIDSVNKAKSMFEKGVDLHNLADIVYDAQFDQQCGSIPAMQYREDFIKVLSDELFYDEFVASGLQAEVLQALSTINGQEILPTIPQEIVKAYHMRVCAYLRDRPQKTTILLYDAGNKTDYLKSLFATAPCFVGNPDVIHATETLSDRFENLFNSAVRYPFFEINRP